MPIKSNMPSLVPARDRFKQEITLLSGGFANPKAFPEGKITVYPWDYEIDEFLIQRARKGRKETLLFDLVPKLCDLNGCTVPNFVMGDVNTILMVSRSIARDNQISYVSECPACGHKEKENLRVPDQLERLGEKKTDYAGSDSITLPVCKDVVAVRPLLVQDIEHIQDRDDVSKGQISDKVAGIIAGVVTINGTKADTMTELATWFKALHPKDAAYLEQQQDMLTPHLGTNIHHKCSKCEKMFDHPIALDADFFRSDSLPSS